MRRVLFLLACLLIPQLASAADLAAGCALRLGGGLLLVQNSPGSRWALPAGYIEAGETPENAAIREVREETGLRVRTREALSGAPKGLRLFACENLAPAEISNGRLNILAAPHLGIETIQAGVFDPQAIDALPLRFPAQRAWLKTLSARIPPGPYTVQADFGAAASARQALELRLMTQWRTDSGNWGPFFLAGSFLGEVWFYILALPLIGRLIGRAAMQRMSFCLGVLVLIAQLAKSLCAQPRPFQFAPALSLDGASGFGMPSGHTLGALFLFGALALWQRKRLPLKFSLPPAILAALWTASARVWLGVHFISDVVAGLMLALLLLAVERWQARHETSDAPWLATRRLHWAVLGILSLAIGLAGKQSSLLLPLALSLGYLLAGPSPQVHRLDTRDTLWLLTGMIALFALASTTARHLGVVWQSLAAYTLGLTLLGAWLAGWSARSRAAWCAWRSSKMKS